MTLILINIDATILTIVELLDNVFFFHDTYKNGLTLVNTSQLGIIE